MKPVAHEINELTARLAVLIEQRNEAIYAAMKGGAKPRQVAEEYDLTRQRVEQICSHFAALEAAGVGDEN